MSIAVVLDEHLRGPLWQAILRHNLRNEHHLDVARVGDTAELPLGAGDSDILRWAEIERRILITEDRHTMAVHLEHHLQSGHHSPGVLIARRGARISELIESLELVALVGEAEDFVDAVMFIP